MNNQLKQYTDTKTVKARPMTMGEAYERKLLKNGVRPSECETDKAGYLVEYEDGYQSWSPKDVFEAAYKPSETFKYTNMKQFIARTICAILLSPILTIMLIGYIPFAIFKGLTDSFTFNEYSFS